MGSTEDNGNQLGSEAEPVWVGEFKRLREGDHLSSTLACSAANILGLQAGL